MIALTDDMQGSLLAVLSGLQSSAGQRLEAAATEGLESFVEAVMQATLALSAPCTSPAEHSERQRLCETVEVSQNCGWSCCCLLSNVFPISLSTCIVIEAIEALQTSKGFKYLCCE